MSLAAGAGRDAGTADGVLREQEAWGGHPEGPPTRNNNQTGTPGRPHFQTPSCHTGRAPGGPSCGGRLSLVNTSTKYVYVFNFVNCRSSR